MIRMELIYSNSRRETSSVWSNINPKKLVEEIQEAFKANQTLHFSRFDETVSFNPRNVSVILVKGNGIKDVQEEKREILVKPQGQTEEIPLTLYPSKEVDFASELDKASSNNTLFETKDAWGSVLINPNVEYRDKKTIPAVKVAPSPSPIENIELTRIKLMRVCQILRQFFSSII